MKKILLALALLTHISCNAQEAPLRIVSIETTAQDSSEQGGTITVSIQGGVPPFSYGLNGPVNDLIFPTNDTTVTFPTASTTFLPFGTYLVAVGDSTGTGDLAENIIVNLFTNELTNYIALNAKYCNTQPTEETS